MQRYPVASCQFLKITAMYKKLVALLPLLVCFVLQSCLKDTLETTYTIMRPVYKDKSEVFAGIRSNAPADIRQPGKLFISGQYIFLNEIDKGIHVIDNSNPANPVIKAFINIPGNLDIAVRGTTLYADLYSELVILDISNPLQVRFVKNVPKVFPERDYTNGFVADSNKVIVDWIRKDTTVRSTMSCRNCGYLLYSGGPLAASSPYTGPALGGISTPGMAGSMARFALVNNYLYTVNNNKLNTFNISNSQDPLQTSSIQVGWRIETIYPFKNNLFIGSSTAVFIYDINTPATPVSKGQFNHGTVCDPVIADGNFAYSTLRTGNNCNGGLNQLDVINISNLSSPTLVRSYSLTNPFGLSKDNNILFICDGSAGLRVFDATNPSSIVEKKHISGMNAYDVIAFNGSLVMVAKDGLYQYSYTNADDVILKSKLSVKP
jgi:hypothetical protein